MYDTTDLYNVDDDVLQAELERRSKLRNAPWPRRTTVTCTVEDVDDELGDFLTRNCGFVCNSKEYNEAVGSLSEVELEVEVYSDGQIRAVGFAGAGTDSDTESRDFGTGEADTPFAHQN